MDKPIRYCWDTTVFVAWVKEEPSAPLADMALVVEEIDSKKATLIVSVMTSTEILETKYTPEQWSVFQRCLRRSNVVLADITLAIAELGSRIRAKGESEGGKIKTPDAQIMATAMSFKVDALHSLDADMLALDGSAIVEGLRITLPLPFGKQKGLF